MSFSHIHVKKKKNFLQYINKIIRCFSFKLDKQHK
jgi:hypothetical protein